MKPKLAVKKQDNKEENFLPTPKHAGQSFALH